MLKSTFKLTFSLQISIGKPQPFVAQVTLQKQKDFRKRKLPIIKTLK